MRALTVQPRRPGSLRVGEVPDPARLPTQVLVRGLWVGVCGTDHDIIGGGHGEPPEGQDVLILGHESLGEVVESPETSALQPGDLVVGIVRRPDPVPCSCCGRGRPDMCRNGLYTERGIKQRNGFGSELWTDEEPNLVKVDPALRDLSVLLEPASVVAKAWDRIDRLASQNCAEASIVVVTGAGSIGLLAAVLARQRGLDVHVLDVVEEGPKPELVREVGGTYHTTRLSDLDLHPDIVLECSGVAEVFLDVLQHTAHNGIVCLLGVSQGRQLHFDAGLANRALVLENDVVFGSVNAARPHYGIAAEALMQADPRWLDRMITRRVPLSEYAAAFEPSSDIKVVLDLTR